MNKKLLLIVFSLVLVLVQGCKKGDTGPQGPAGPQGIQGVKGDNGSMIFSGNDVPAASLGVNGDYYFRLSNSMFYGPKTAAGWGTPISLRGATGATGAAGAAGSKILSGTALPGTALGAIGDFYFKTDTYMFFGPKTAAGWRSGVNLRGATGTANVIYSGWMSFPQSQRDTSIDGTLYKVNHIPVPRLTQSLVDQGLIMVYYLFQNSVHQLPYTSDAGAGVGPAKTSTISYLPKPGRILITRYTHDNSASIGFGSIQFRYVIVPGGVVATLQNKNIDLNDPFAVDKALKELKL